MPGERRGAVLRWLCCALQLLAVISASCCPALLLAVVSLELHPCVWGGLPHWWQLGKEEGSLCGELGSEPSYRCWCRRGGSSVAVQLWDACRILCPRQGDSVGDPKGEVASVLGAPCQQPWEWQQFAAL